MFLQMLEFFSAIILILMIVTQILIPLAQQRLTFPLFRRRATLEKEIASLHSDLDDTGLAQQARDLRDAVNATVSPIDGTAKKVVETVTKGDSA